MNAVGLPTRDRHADQLGELHGLRPVQELVGSEARCGFLVELDGYPHIETCPRDTEVQSADHAVIDAGSSLLVASNADGTRIGIELSVVQRLEQFAGDQVERSGPREVIQYRGTILPLIRVAEILPRHPEAAPLGALCDASAPLKAVVCRSSAGLVGLVVEQIDDVVSMPTGAPQPLDRRGTASLVVGDRVTQLLDVEALIADVGLERIA